MTLATLAPRAGSPAITRPGGWQVRGACLTSSLDLAELTPEAAAYAGAGDGTYPVETRRGTTLRRWSEDLETARALCSVCPVLAQCRADVLTSREAAGASSGVVAGLTEPERAAWRREHGIPPVNGWVLHLIERDGRLLVDLTTVTRNTPRSIAAEELVAVARLVAEDWTSEEIAARLVTVYPSASGPVEVPWTSYRVKHARRILAGSRGARDRVPA